MVSKKILAIVCVAFSSLTMMAQKDTIKKNVSDRLDNFSFGLALNQYGGNNGAGFTITSPHFHDSTDDLVSIAIRLTLGANHIEGILPSETNISDFIYYPINLGITEEKIIIRQKILLYWEVGGTFILANNQYTSEPTRWGMYVLPGVELYPSLHSGVFFEMGFSITQKCIADKLIGDSYYYMTDYSTSKIGSGLLLAVGFHDYL